MFIKLVRSSSYGSYKDCEHRFFLEYVLGYKGDSNIKAVRGTMFHKVAEGLAHKKLAEQDGRDSYEDDAFGKVLVEDITIENLTNWSYDHYRERYPQFDWKEKEDKKILAGWTDVLLNGFGGNYNPLTSHIITPEKTFDITINKPWAQFDYGFDKGYLKICGTSDLARLVDKDVVEIIDYKTGARLEDWSTGETKDFDYFMEDFQLRLYHYAMSQAFPWAKTIMMTILFMNFYPFTLVFDQDDLPKTEETIREHFETVRSNKLPQLKSTTKNKWQCRFCSFSKGSFNDTGIPPCNFFANQVKLNGVDETFHQFGRKEMFGQYGEGGGRQSWDTNKKGDDRD